MLDRELANFEFLIPNRTHTYRDKILLTLKTRATEVKR